VEGQDDFAEGLDQSVFGLSTEGEIRRDRWDR
jgi:hypothetical protein